MEDSFIFKSSAPITIDIFQLKYAIVFVFCTFFCQLTEISQNFWTFFFR